MAPVLAFGRMTACIKWRSLILKCVYIYIYIYIYIYTHIYKSIYIFEHFSEEGRHSFLEDVSITLIDKTDPSNPLQRENYWRSTLKTMVPWGLNVEGCV